MKRRRLALPLALTLGAGGIVTAKGDLSWDDMTEADWIYTLATRVSTVDGRSVHYPTPTAEFATILETRSEPSALRHLADARRELGDRAGALSALEKWAEAEGPEAWDEAARWANELHEWTFAFGAAEKALPGLPAPARRALADERVRWADAHPEMADPLALRRARAALFPEDPRSLEDWVRALEKAGRLDEAEAALAASGALTAERRLLLRSDLQADHGNAGRALEILDEAVGGETSWGRPVAQAFARRVERGAPLSPEAWRATLERSFDAPALVRLATCFEGQGRGDAAADLLRQVERRYEATLDRRGWLLLERLHAEIDAVPEAFRDRLAAAQRAAEADRTDDLAPLARLALRAGGRPLAWGTYNDEPYRWVARVDRTPGFWTGGLSFLLTGQDWKDALGRLESESMPERTFATARALADELARRNASNAALPALRLAIMERHVERGDGAEALNLLPILEAASPEIGRDARRVALLAMRQVTVPLTEELRLHRSRLRDLAADGTRPTLAATPPAEPYGGSWNAAEPWRRLPSPPATATYAEALEEAISRVEERDRSHRASLELLLGEMDRLPEDEALWADLAGRLEGWNLDDELGPRYERALARFKEPGIWHSAARWYARRSRRADLELLAVEIAARFRGAEVFARTESVDVTLPVREQPVVGTRVRLVPWADWVRLKALQRFPHSRRVFQEALGRLQSRRDWDEEVARRGTATLLKEKTHRVVVEDSLLEERRAALLFVDPARREEWMAARMRDGSLEARLEEMERSSRLSPVEDQLLLDGWARLSRYERSAEPADRLAAAYPGDGELAERVLTLHRSLAALDPSQARAAHSVVERTASALADAGALWTALGELEEDRGRPDLASVLWKRLLEGEARNADKVAELATLLWDYGHMAEALAVVEEGRRQTKRPRFFAFEAGVLREENRAIAGAVDEYLAALWPEEGDCFCSAFERDQRSLRRLGQLMGREKVRSLVEKRIASLRPGVKADEEALASLFPLATIAPPDPGLSWDADGWIDAMDVPNDPIGRNERKTKRDQARGGDQAGTARIGDVLLARAMAMVPSATTTEFLDAARRWAEPLLEARAGREGGVTFESLVLARRAALASTEEDRIAREVERARYLLDHDRRQEADALWASLAPRIERLPEGAPRMHAEAERAGFLERSQDHAAADAAWRTLSTRYAWSLGVLEDHLAFLTRQDRGADERRLLEETIPRAAPGHREALLQRLTREALDAHDVPQARRAVDALLGGNLSDAERLGAIHLLARLSFKENASFDPMALAGRESEKLKHEMHADLFHELARAADAEKASASVPLWIEALNRRLEREWLAEALRSADRTGQGASFLDFFERQRQRSPRDVRWAVAAREIKRHADDLAGAIAMAKTAVGVRPERESLWREAVDLLVRAGQLREAADYLEGWNAPRRADESVAGWRSDLYSRAGDGDRALAVERAALEAFTREGPLDDDRSRELEARRARAARRLVEYGHPRLAWRLLAPDDAPAKVAASALSETEQAELALANDSFLRLLRSRAGDDSFRATAGRALADRGRPEQREEALAWVMRQLFPGGAGAPGSEEALRRWWPFVGAAGLEGSVRRDLATRWIARTPGPWGAAASATFTASVGSQMVAVRAADGDRVLVLQAPELEGLWVRELVRSDREAELGTFLDARWSDLVGRALSPMALPSASEPLPWAAWLADRTALETWSRYLAGKPEALSVTARVFASRRSWDRFWALAAKRWEVAPLVAILPETERVAWFRLWETPAGTAAEDPVLRARREIVEKASLAVGRLVAGAPGAARDPILRKLRGPRTIDDLLGSDPQWLWTEFMPRKDAAGAIVETGDYRVTGQGKDAGRLPGSLWGERPGEAWFVLEALVRFREGNADAPLVPSESRDRGRETERALLGVRLAMAEGNAPLALDMAEEHPGRADDPAWRSAHLRLLATAGRGERAREILQRDIRHAQASLTEAGLRTYETLAQDVGLAPALDLLDASSPVPPALLAYLRDRRGADVAARFTTSDRPGFRAALASRWAERERDLSTEQLRFFLSELWAQGAAPLPRRGLATLGGFWPHAADWLDRQRVSDRAEALEAVASLPDAARLDGLAARGHETDDVIRLLQVRAALGRNEDDRALAWVDAMTGALIATDSQYTLEAAPPSVADGDGDPDAALSTAMAPSEDASDAADPIASRLNAWLRPFRDVKRAATVEARFRSLLAARRADGPVSLASWRLALELGTSAEDRKALLAELEHAWIRGDWAPEGLGALVDALARFAPAEAPRWMARWTQRFKYDETARRAQDLVRIQYRAGAARVLIDARPRGGWTRVEEVRAFDLWRSVSEAATTSGATPPATWSAALPFWKSEAGSIGSSLLVHLKAHPFDLLAARSALRTVLPEDEEAMRHTAAVLEDPAMAILGSQRADETLLDLRIARWFVSRSWRAARSALGTPSPSALAEDLRRRRFGPTEIDDALSDVARLAARADDTRTLDAALTVLSERGAPVLTPLRAETAAMRRPDGPPPAFRLVDGRPAPYRPRDLDWRVLATVLDTGVPR